MAIRRVAHIGDIHLDASPGGRLAEKVRVLEWITQDAARRGVDLFLQSGDVYERKSTPEERAAAARWIQDVTRFAPLLIVRGNHDFPGDLSLFTRLETDHEVIVEESAGVHVVGGCIVGAVAWPSKASVLAQLREVDADIAQQEASAEASHLMRTLLFSLGAQMKEVQEARDMMHAPRILAMHAMVRGSRASTGQPLVGHDAEVGIEDIRQADCQYYGLAHIHARQEWGGDMVYAGSISRNTFGETEQKGYVVAEFDDGVLTGWAFIPTPCAPMILLEDEWGPVDDGDTEDGWMVGDGGGDVEGAEVRFRFTCEPDKREAAAEAAEEIKQALLAAGAVDVKIEPRVRPACEARAPEVAKAKTLAEKVDALWTARGTMPEPERRAALHTKLAELERADQETVA
jgi:DNA repair protein SbcD/Mre11